jgi:serine protease Do
MRIHARSLTALVVGLALGLSAALAGSGIAAPGAPAPSPAAINAATFATLAETVKPAVINVNVRGKSPSGRPRPEDFFGGPDRTPRRGLGSGVIIDASGVALTNAHVVDGATEIDVVTLDGSRYKATVVGTDRKTDLAVLRLQDGKGPFPFLPLGDSDETRVGDWVIAVGSPFGLQATVTSGIISAKARDIGAGPYDDFLQTDAAINPGNSGGPLVDMRGRVVGINTAIVRGASGIGFAIPSNVARRVSSEILATGRVTRGWLGVALQPLTTDLAQSFAVEDRRGALVAEVVPDSPAAKAGLEAGDVVLEINGARVADPGDVARAVGLARPGEAATLIVWRNRGRRTVAVTLGEAPGDREAAAGRLGLEVSPVTPEVARERNLHAEAGLREPVRTLADFARSTAADAGTPLSVRVERDGRSLYVAVTPERKQG